METIYSDYDHKDFKRILVQMKRKSKKPMNGWDLSHYISALSSSYYKLELLYAIAIAIREGIRPNDIFVMDGSFGLNFSSANLKPSSLTGNGLNILYNIGNPISLYPNRELFMVRLIFQLYHNINNFFSLKKCKRLTRYTLNKAYEIYRNSGFFNSYTYIMNIAKTNLEESEKTRKYPALTTEQRAERLRVNREQLEKIKERVLTDYEKFENIYSEGIFTYISDCLNKNREIVFEEKWIKQKFHKSDIMNQYFYIFYTKLSRLTRPVVGVYDKQNKKINFLCSGHIRATQDFFDIKKVSRDSPLTILIESGIQIFFMVLGGVISILFLLKKIKLENDNINKTKGTDIKTIEERIRREVELEAMYKELEKTHKKEIQDIENKYQVKMTQLTLDARINYLEKEFYKQFYEKYFQQRKPVLLAQQELEEDRLEEDGLNSKLKNEANELLWEYEAKMLDLKDMLPIDIGENIMDIYENECEKAFRILKKYKF